MFQEFLFNQPWFYNAISKKSEGDAVSLPKCCVLSNDKRKGTLTFNCWWKWINKARKYQMYNWISYLLLFILPTPWTLLTVKLQHFSALFPSSFYDKSIHTAIKSKEVITVLLNQISEYYKGWIAQKNV